MAEPYRRADLTDLTEAVTAWTAVMQVLPEEWVDAHHVVGRVLTRPLVAPVDLPPFARSAVDGYALRSRDTERATPAQPVRLSHIRDIEAGTAPGDLQAKTAVRVNTGSALPEGADSVAMLEWVRHPVGTEPADDQAGSRFVHIARAVPPGANVRVRGEDAPMGSVVLPAGQVVGADQLPLVLACLGAQRAAVRRMPRVVVVPTGSELALPGEAPADFQVTEVVGLGIAARVEAAWEGMGRVTVSVRRPVPDDPRTVRKVLTEALAAADLVCTVGGAALGTRDHTRRALEALGGTILFHGVRLRPGTPALGGVVEGKVVLGLPGNPVAAFTVWDLLGRAALAALSGTEPPRPQPCVLAERVEKRPVQEDRYLRARLWADTGGILRARVYPGQNAGRLVPLARTNGFVRYPAGRGELAVGEVAEAWLTGPMAAADPGGWAEP